MLRLYDRFKQFPIRDPPPVRRGAANTAEDGCATRLSCSFKPSRDRLFAFSRTLHLANLKFEPQKKSYCA
jgi:hypothetical protein